MTLASALMPRFKDRFSRSFSKAPRQITTQPPQQTTTLQSARLFEPEANFVGKLVLLLDNEPQLRHAVAELLRSWQCDVLAISQPSAAMTQLQQHFAVQCPVVIHSADQQHHTRDHALNAGCHFMLKPLKAADLKRLLQRLLH